MGEFKITWNQVQEYITTLVSYIKKKDLKFSGVYGIPRGGVILATMLSYKLSIPLLMAPTKDCIIVDDIADSGRSLLHYTVNDTQFNKYFITTMVFHERSVVTPDFYLYNKEDKWIKFPWENEEEL